MPRLDTVAIMSPGDMGHTAGMRLREGGLRVIAWLEGRSERTRALAREAGIEEVPSLDELVREADALLSILVPAQAEPAAATVADALARTGADLLYADCNAIAPQTARRIGERITATGGRLVDVSIIGGPPQPGGGTRFYASGPFSRMFAALGERGLGVVDMAGEAGDASALKMCYAALTKGLTAIATELLAAARLLGVSEALQAELRDSQAPLYERITRSLGSMAERSRRWVGEMEEIAATFAAVGLPRATYLGAAEVYELVGRTPLADRTPEDASARPTPEELIDAVARLAAARSGGAPGGA